MTFTITEGQIRLRRMLEGDLPEVEALDQACFSDPWPKGAFTQELNSVNSNLCLVAEDSLKPEGQKVVAVAVFWLIVDELHLGTIGVLPQYRKQRIALALLVDGLLIGYQMGSRSSLLEVRAGNTEALGLYQSLGFQVVGRRGGYYQDNQEDALLLTLAKIEAAKLKMIHLKLPNTIKSDLFRVESALGVNDAS
ncbi:MAG TPA: ribosomal protein S18-alanine N-acetyltransferase [Anaerolineaceae bacterium]|nr:ribosomal protein S18-alanine N-acetyltransferase [Anaerolineaceae bacterium]